MSEKDELRKSLEEDLHSEDEEEEETQEQIKEEAKKYITAEDVDEILNKKFPQKEPKTRAKKMPKEDEEGEIDVKDQPTCPKCRKVVKETADGWVCFNCGKYYSR